MLLQVILEGIGLGVLLILVCAIGICKGAVGMVHLYSQEVQERCVTLGLTTHAKIKRNALVFKAVCVPGYIAYVLVCVYALNGAKGFVQGFWQLLVILSVMNLIDRFWVDGYWVGHTNAWEIPGTEDLKPYITAKDKGKKWLFGTIGMAVISAALAAIMMLFMKYEVIEMLLQTYGDRRNPAVLFFHAMGVTGASSEPIARYLQDRYFCILPTSTVYCEGQKYVSKQDEIRQVEDFLHRQGVERLAMVVASSIGADLAMAFLTQTKLPVEHAFFDGGQFAQIGKGTRRIMTPFLYFTIKSLYWSKGGTLKKILWCDDDSIKSYFIDAGKNLTYTNLRRQILDSLEDKPFPALSEELQKHLYFEFGSIEDHFKYRQAVIEAYPCGNYPVFEGYDHMQYQIRDPKGFAEMLAFIAEQDGMPKLPFIRK